MDIQKLQQILSENNQLKFRLQQIQKAIFQDGISSFSQISTVSKDLRELLEKEIKILSFEVEKVLVAKDGQSIKALLKLSDGELIETVLISPKPDVWSACISCQVGCAMGCRFCATGKMGFKRDLTAEEITDQILFWRQYLKRTLSCRDYATSSPEWRGAILSTIVYMGMGESFNNWREVSQSIKNLTDEKLFGFGSRSLSVSTSGIAEGIEKLATEFPQVNLAISLHFASDEKRDRFMPVNKKDNLENLRNALKNYFEATKRKVFLEYIMLEGINDTALDAKLLAEYIGSIGHKQLLHVNLIRYNTIVNPPAGGLKSSSKQRTQSFKQELEKNHVMVTIRKSLGEEIKGACGQLAAK
jgi:23S rRNA (adenine(2503)-C(2))-methyltransferase